MNALNAIVRFASIIMIPLGLALFASSVSELWDAAGTPGDSALSWCFSELLAGHVPSSALLSTVGALLGMIPQGLVLLTSSVLAIATVRLARRRCWRSSSTASRRSLASMYCAWTRRAPSRRAAWRSRAPTRCLLRVLALAWTRTRRLFPSIPQCSILRWLTWHVRLRPMPTRPARRCSTITPIARSRCLSRCRSFRSRRLKNGVALRLRRAPM